MADFLPVYIPAAVPTFHMGIAQDVFSATRDMLRRVQPDMLCPDELLLSPEAITGFLAGRSPDAVIFQNVTFANAAYISEVLRLTDCPVLLWAVREPSVPGGRLCLNSLTGVYSAANACAQIRGRAPGYILGDPAETQTEQAVTAFLNAARLKKELHGMTVAAVGHTPQGFGFGQGSDTELLRLFGTRLITAEARELIRAAQACTDEDAKPFLLRSEQRMTAFDATPAENRLAHARLYKAYSDFIRKNNVGALASRCWPDYFTDYGTPVCAVLSLLNDDGVACSCETDLNGALSMKLGMLLCGGAVFFGDPAAIDENENTMTFWHCGMAPCSMARTDTGAVTGVHPNRKIGPAMDFACRPFDGITLFRIDRKSDGRCVFFLAEGTAPDAPKRFIGTSITVRPDASARAVADTCIRNGLAPHYAVIPGRHAAPLRALADMLGIDVISV